MRTWLQPVEYRTGPAGKPRRVHLRRVVLEEQGTYKSPLQPVLTVVSVAKRALCSVGNIIPCPAGTRATCPQCLRLAEPFWLRADEQYVNTLISEKEQPTEEDEYEWR